MKKTLTFLLLVAVGGCATPYRAIEDTGGMGGYYHQRLADDTFKVVFSGNGFTEYKRAHDFALLRAAEICHELGYTHFVKEGQEDRSRTSVVDMGSTSYTSGSVYGYGDSASYYGTTTTHSNSMPVLKPGVELVVRYFQGEPLGRYLEIFEAESVIRRLALKYGLDLGKRAKPIKVMQPDNAVLTQKPTSELTTEPKVEVTASERQIRGYKLKRDASGEPAKDENGNFIFIPVYEEEQKK